MRLISLGSVVLAASCFVPSTSAQSNGVFATKVIDFDTLGNAGGGVFDPNNALGAPSASATAVHSLGVGGFLTLGFAVTVTDGPGADLIVFENPFRGSGNVYSEAMFVEVSSNGRDFARFENHYRGPAASGGAFALSKVYWFQGFAGINVHRGGTSGVDPFDVVQAGGDAFDLADLKTHPLVLSGQIDLTKITQVRLVDVIAGVSRDSAKRIIQDPTAGSADVNAVAVIHHVGNVKGDGPEVELTMPANGNFALTIRDRQGLLDLDPSTLRMSYDGFEFPPSVLIQGMTLSSLTNDSVTWVLGGTLPANLLFHLSVSVKDKAGARSGQTRVR